MSSFFPVYLGGKLPTPIQGDWIWVTGKSSIYPLNIPLRILSCNCEVTKGTGWPGKNCGPHVQVNLRDLPSPEFVPWHPADGWHINGWLIRGEKTEVGPGDFYITPPNPGDLFVDKSNLTEYIVAKCDCSLPDRVSPSDYRAHIVNVRANHDIWTVWHSYLRRGILYRKPMEWLSKQPTNPYQNIFMWRDIEID